MKYPIKNVKGSSSTKEKTTTATTTTTTTTTTTNLLANAAKMKITKAIANAKFQAAAKSTAMPPQSLYFSSSIVRPNKSLDEHLLCASEKDQIGRTSEQKKQIAYEQAASCLGRDGLQSLVLSHTQAQVNSATETATVSAEAAKTYVLVKAERSSPQHEKVDFNSAHDRDDRALGTLSSATSSAYTNTTHTVPLRSVSVAPQLISVPNEQSNQTVLRTAAQVSVENSSNSSSSAICTPATTKINYDSENNRCSDVVNNTTTTRNQHFDKNSNIDKCSNTTTCTTTTTNTNTTTITIDNTTTTATTTTHSSKTNVVNATSSSSNVPIVTTTTATKSNIAVINNGVTTTDLTNGEKCVLKTEISEQKPTILQSDHEVKQQPQHRSNYQQHLAEDSLQQSQQLSTDIVPINYRGHNNSVIIANYNNQSQQQQQQASTATILYQQHAAAADVYLRYQQHQEEQQDCTSEQEQRQQQQQPNFATQPNISEIQQQNSWLHPYSNCVYDLSLHHHQLSQQHQQHHDLINEQHKELLGKTDYATLHPSHLHLQQQQQYATLSTHALQLQHQTPIFDDNNRSNSTNMPGNLTLYSAFGGNPHDHHHPHHLQVSQAHNHSPITHAPPNLNEIIEDAVKGDHDCIDDHQSAALSYYALSAVSDLPGLKDNIYQQQLVANEQHLAQQQQQQQQYQNQPLLQHQLQSINHHQQHNNSTGASSGGESPPHMGLGSDMSGTDMVTLQSYTQLTNAVVTHRDHYGNLTPDHTPNMYFRASLSPGLQNRCVQIFPTVSFNNTYTTTQKPNLGTTVPKSIHWLVQQLLLIF